MTQRPALGRGLSSLIPQAGGPDAVAGNAAAGVATVDIDLIAANPEQPRLVFEAEALRELSESIREHGVLQPVVVTSVVSDLGPVTYQLIAGERRLQASRMAGLTRMPVVIREAAGRELLELALVENLQRQELNPLEEAQAFDRMSREFGMTQDEIATRVGRSRTSVTNTMRLLLLEADIRASLASGQISEGHARALLQIEEGALRLDAWRKIVSDGLNVRQSEDVARALRDMQTTSRRRDPIAPRGADPHVRAIEDDLRHALGSPVVVRTSGKGGRIVIRFHSPEELDGIIERITGGS